jgi:hypothetical protein
MFMRVRRHLSVFYPRQRKPMRADDPRSMLLAAQQLPVTELPALMAQLEEIRCIAQLRIVTAQPAPTSDHDELLTINEAALRLRVSKDHLYRTDYPFTRRIGRRHRFSAKGIEEFLGHRAILPSSHQRAYTPSISAIQRKRARKGREDENQNRSGNGQDNIPTARNSVEAGSTPQH